MAWAVGTALCGLSRPSLLNANALTRRLPMVAGCSPIADQPGSMSVKERRHRALRLHQVKEEWAGTHLCLTHPVAESASAVATGATGGFAEEQEM